jgi:hypothetical protein
MSWMTRYKPEKETRAVHSATHEATHEAISAVWRIESAKIVATVARMVRDIGLAEELAQDALVAALEHWPQGGVPDNPAAWLVTAAKRKALDHLRHLKMRGEKLRSWAMTWRRPGGAGRAGFRGCAGRGDAGRHRRRPAAPDLHRLPPGAVHRRAGGAHAASCWAG